MRGEKGSSLVLVMVMVLVLAAMVTLVASTAATRAETVDTARDEAESLAIAQAGLDITATRIAALPTATDLSTDALDARLAGVTLGEYGSVVDGNADGGSKTAGNDVFSGNNADLDAFVPFGAGHVLTEISASAPVTVGDTTTRYLTVRATGVGRGEEARSAIETIIKEVTKTTSSSAPQPYKAGDHMLPGAMSIVSEKKISSATHYVDKGASVLGYDHDVEGKDMDPTSGVDALGVSEECNVEWGVFDNKETGTIEGPDTSMNEPADHVAILSSINEAAKTHADTKVFEPNSNNKYWEQDGGTIGSPDDPAVIWVDATDHDMKKNGGPLVKLSNNFEGYGLLVVSISNGDSMTEAVVEITGNSKWHGLILVVTGSGTQIRDKAMISLEGNGTGIVGGAAILTRDSDDSGNGVWKEQQSGYSIYAGNDTELLYSSAAVAMAASAVDVTKEGGSVDATTTTHEPTGIICRVR
jgi:hypothetical protein